MSAGPNHYLHATRRINTTGEGPIDRSTPSLLLLLTVRMSLCMHAKIYLTHTTTLVRVAALLGTLSSVIAPVPPPPLEAQEVQNDLAKAIRAPLALRHLM